MNLTNRKPGCFAARFLLCLAGSLLYSYVSFAQWENVWAFGIHAGLDFNTIPPSPYQTSITGFGEACASVCDADGNLLFYTNGNQVWDKNNNMMPNGAALCPGFSSCDALFTTSSTSQGAMIIPMPDNTSLYYIISLTAWECGNDVGRLYYSIVDMNLNDGNGDIVAAHKGILIDSGLTERMTAVSGNACNMWLLALSQTDVLKAYELSATGDIAPPVISSLSSDTPAIAGKIIISPDRERLVITNYSGGKRARLCHFDPVTGMVSDPVYLGGEPYTYGACFSPDNNKLYINNEVLNTGTSQIYQFDISTTAETAILASQTFIGTVPLPLVDIKRGPDEKLYFPSQYSAGNNSYLGAILQPDLTGLSCNFEPEYIALPNTMNFFLGEPNAMGLPNIVPFISGGSDTVIINHPDIVLCFVGSFQLDLPDSAVNLIWNNGDNSHYQVVYNTGHYWAQYNFPHTPCTLHTDTFAITINSPLPGLAITPSCNKMSNGNARVIVVADEAAYSFVWQDASGTTLSAADSLTGVPAGSYTVHIVTPEGCDTMLHFSIPEEHYQMDFSGDSLVCTNEAVFFQNFSDPYYTAFKWYLGTGDSSMLTDCSYAYVDAGIYQVMLAAEGERCKDTAYKTIVVDAPVPAAFYVDREGVCMGEAVSLNISGLDSTVTDIIWQFGDGTTTSITGENQVLDHVYDTSGLMAVSLLVNSRACPDTLLRDTIQVYPFPIVNLSYDSALCLGGSPVRLENLIADTGTCHYEWSTGDTTAGIEIRHPGTYSLTVTQEPAGCATTDAVTVDKDCYIGIPNAFTPNGDGANDYFFPRQYLSKSVIQFRMQVFNRWGQKIFETTSIEGRGWDGRFNGNEQPAGVYVYIIDVTLAGDRQEHYQGNVTLLR